MTKQLTPHQNAALDYTKHISLAANAGSGKTFVLSKRFVEIYKNEEVDLNAIVAITFTDKAAGELNKKIADETEEQISNEKNVFVKRRLEKLRRELVLANISTIHSFCINILKEFAPEAGIDANFSPIDQLLSDELIELSIEETFQSLIRDTEISTDFMPLVRVLGSKMFLKSAVKDAIHQRRNVDIIANNLYSKSVVEIAGEFKTKFTTSIEATLAPLIMQGISAIKKINDHVLKNDSANKYARPISEYLDEINDLPIERKLAHLSLIKKELITSTENSVRKLSYLNKNRIEFTTEIECIENLFEQIVAFADIDSSGKSEIELAEFGKSFLKIYKCTLENYSNKKKHRSYLDFEDILLMTHKIISLPAVQTYLHEKYKYIMIDEYQDTNELQYDIFMPILDHLQIGNLFVVGDEKQSIYMFRDAELEVFNKTKQEIVKTAELGSNLSLPHSFRMYPQLVLFTNKVFENLFSNPQKEFNEVPHSDLVCTKSAGDIGNVGILLADTPREIEESEIVACKIVELLKNDGTLIFGDIAILCRKRKSFSELETSLVKYGVPYVIMGGKGFYQRQTIYDVYNYISFLINPKDDQALIGVLRSPFFNLSDSKLLKISFEVGDSFYDKLITLAKSDASIKPIVSSIEKNINGIVSSEPYSLIRKILNESGYWAVLASKKNSDQEIANVEKLLALSREYSSKGFKNLYDFSVALKEFIEGYEDEGQAQVAQDQNAVKLMTIHQSKGLEFKAVFIYGTNSKAQEDNVRARMLSISKEFGLLTKVPIDKKYFSRYAYPPIAAFHNYKVKRKNNAELKRLLYVAVTRAIKHLYISATHKEFKPVAGSFYDLLCDGLRNDFQTENIYLAADVEFMLQQENDFVNEKKQVELNISIEKEIAEADLPANEKTNEVVQKSLRNHKIGDSPKHEIISATKISMYTQCPVKYELTYDIGFLPVLNLIKRQESVYEFQPKEEVESIKQFAQLRGSIIHKCLSENIEIEKLSDYINNLLLAETNEETVKLSDSIKTDIQSYYKSKTYNELNSYPDYRNEYEVYCQEGEFYLYGIIDKLIIENGKLIVVDYKTDSVEKEKLSNRAENYFPQLKFYSYVLSKLFVEVTGYELRLVFIKHPDELVNMSLSKSQVEEYGNVIRPAIQNIHSFNFIPNLEHCRRCQFALEGDKCVKSI